MSLLTRFWSLDLFPFTDERSMRYDFYDLENDQLVEATEHNLGGTKGEGEAC